jgi:hypothetical protein
MGTNDPTARGEHARDYVDRVRAGTHRYAQDLLEENERLRLLASSLESERARLEERTTRLEGVERDNQALKGLLLALERDKARLQEQLIALHEESERRAREQARLREEMLAIQDRSQQFSQQFVEIERQNSNLANLYVASYRLHGTLDRREVLASIEEILANLVGSEQTAIFEMNPSGDTLLLLSANGVDPARYASVAVGSGPLGRVAASGEAFLAGPGGRSDRSPDEPELTAAIPLTLEGRVTGAIAVFRLLPQKPGLEDLDRELFDLLATHAATALYCSTLHARSGP